MNWETFKAIAFALVTILAAVGGWFAIPILLSATTVAQIFWELIIGGVFAVGAVLMTAVLFGYLPNPFTRGLEDNPADRLEIPRGSLLDHID
jgi:hypothetical protein